jgi:hypothetical protein
MSILQTLETRPYTPTYIVFLKNGEHMLYSASNSPVPGFGGEAPRDCWMMFPKGRLVGEHQIPLGEYFKLADSQEFVEDHREKQVLHENGLVHDDIYYRLVCPELGGCVRTVSRSPWKDWAEKNQGK